MLRIERRAFPTEKGLNNPSERRQKYHEGGGEGPPIQLKESEARMEADHTRTFMGSWE